MSDPKPAPLTDEVAFTVLSVSDMSRSREFYTRVLGLAETANWEDMWVEYDIGATTLALTRESKEMPVGGSGVMIGLEVPDLEAAIAAVKARGGSLKGAPWDSPACRGQRVDDPDGYAFLLHLRKSPPQG